MEKSGVFSDFDNINMPYSIESEQAVLGSVLIDPSCLSIVQMKLRPDHFYLPQHQAIYAVMITIDTEGGMIDPLVVLERLKKESVYDDAGGKNYLYQISQAVPSTANIESYIKIVVDKYFKRTLITVAKEILDNTTSESENAELLLDEAEQKIYNIRQGKVSGGPSKLIDIIMNEVYDNLNKLNSPDKDLYKGYASGYSELDNLISGFNRSDLVLIGARPSVGKTSFALNLARNVSLLGKRKVLFFSLEMTKEQLAQRVLSTEARVLTNRMRNGELTPEDWQSLIQAAGILKDCELYFDDSTNITVPEMKARIRRLKDVDCVFIDYLGLIRPSEKKENRVQEVSDITRNLKLMAKDMNIPVICCSQLSRGTEGRNKSHRPMLSDLRESGSIEQDADIVMLLYRPNYYPDDQNNNDIDDEDVNVNANDVEVIVAKNRHGPTGDIKMLWDPEHTLFITMEHNNL